jgi:hypothetical protein
MQKVMTIAIKSESVSPNILSKISRYLLKLLWNCLKYQAEHIERKMQVHSFTLGTTTLYEFWTAQQLASIYFYPVPTFSN